MLITITTDRNPEGWGEYVSDETAAKAAELLAERLAEYARGQWPEAEVETNTRHLPCGDMSYAARVEDAGRPCHEVSDIIGDIHHEQQRIWTEVLDEVVTDEDMETETEEEE
jgi:hypothetical protein